MKDEIDDLRGRIDGVAQALLWLAAQLEMERVIDGPQLSARWRGRRAPAGAPAATVAASLRTLAQMADALDAARAVRRSRGQSA